MRRLRRISCSALRGKHGEAVTALSHPALGGPVLVQSKGNDLGLWNIMRVELIHAPIGVNQKAVQATRPSLPLGLAYIAAVLRESGHDVSVLDAVQRKPDQLTRDGRFHYIGLCPEEIAEAVSPEADVIGIGVMFSFTWSLAKRIVRLVKERYPEKVVIGGGEHFTGMPEYSLRAAPLDYLVLGEGEETTRELVDVLESGDRHPSSVNGLAYLEDGAFIQTEPRKRIRDLDSLPWPAWDLFEPEAYYFHGHVFGIDTGMTMPVLATRGCPYACTYCSNPMMWGRRWYARNPADVAAEMSHYHDKYGATNFPFHDLTAILKKDWIVEFCHELLRLGLRVNWQLPIGTRTEAIDREVTDLLKQTGCNSITFGPESGSERTRRLIGKQLDEQSLMRAVNAAVASRLNVSSFFVIGFPHDTVTDLLQSVSLAFRLAVAGTNDIALSCFFPIPGTRLYDELMAAGRIDLSDEFLLTPLFSMDAVVSEANNYCVNMSAYTLTLMKYVILLTFYSWSFIVRPWRAFQLVWNVVRDRETCRLDIFLNDRKRRLLRKLGFRRRPAG